MMGRVESTHSEALSQEGVVFDKFDFDFFTFQTLLQAKNLPPDPQTLLQQPMWTTAMQFLQTPATSSAIISDNNVPSNLLATGTAYKQVQIYDIRQSSSSASRRRPVLYTPEHLLSHRITALCQLHDGNTLVAGDATGDCHLLDVRKMHSGKQFSAKSKAAKEEIRLGRLVGPGGSIRQLSIHPSGLPYVACVGLDRKLWTWDVKRRRMVDCVYLRQRLNCLLFCEDGTWDDTDEDNDDRYGDGDVEDDNGGVGAGVDRIKRERELEDEEDEVRDYVGSEDDDDIAVGRVTDVSKRNKESSVSSEGTASDSSEEDSSDDMEKEKDANEEESTASEEEPAVVSSTKKRRWR